MNKALKIFLWIIVILAVLAAFAFFFGKNYWDKISFSKPQIHGLDLQGLTLGDFVNAAFTGTERTINATLGIDIKNDNSFSIPFGNMKIKLLYNNVVVAQTSDAFANQKFTVPANGTLTVSDTINVLLNNAGAFLVEKIKGKHPQMDYVINLRVSGIPLPSIKNSFTW